ncbi:DUF5688 family protein [[Clostridium] fimetarium]|nr:DUF5688 family protein [[Clostridium] fimetarium]
MEEKEMTFEIFNKMVVDLIIKKTIGKYYLKINKVIKNNDCELTSITLLDSANKCVPCVYLENYFKPETTIADIPNIVEEIINTVENNQMTVQNFDWISQWKTAKEKISCKIVNTNRNEKLLESVPNRSYLNLSIIYYLDISDGCVNGESVQGTSLVRNEQLKMWNVSENDLYEAAVENIIGSGTLKTMEQIMNEFLDSGSEEELEDFDFTDDGNIGMYVVSNKNRIYGAAVLLDLDFMVKLSKRFVSGFYILPSSIHELIIVPYSDEISVKELNEMVNQVNESEVSESDFLSNSVYFYDSTNKKILIAA